MSTIKQRSYADDIRAQQKKAKAILVESPVEVASMLGLELWEFEILTGEEAYCADEEIFLTFQGKEMRIYIDEDGKLCVYTD
jgi:hypothetical protein